MRTLAERHEDRAQRKADNAVESADYNNAVGGGVGHVANLMAEAETALGALTDTQKDELKALMSETRDGFANPSDAYGDAFDGSGNLRTAGVGVVNPLIAPASARQAVEGESGTAGAGGSGGWGEDARTDLPEGTNPNGAAVENATGGTDNPPPAPDKPATGGKTAKTTPAS